MTRRDRGDGSVYFSTSKQRWIAQVDITKPGGRRRFRKKLFLTEHQAVRQLRQWRKDLAALSDDGKGPLLGVWLSAWLESPRVKLLAATTRTQYASVVNLHVLPHLGTVPITALTQGRLDRWLDDLSQAGVGPSSVIAARNVLRIALAFAVRRDVLTVNPLLGLRLDAKPAPRVRALSVEELHTLLDAATPWMRTAIATMALGGLRRGELLGLWWDDVDWSTGTVKVVRTIVAKVDRTPNRDGTLRLPGPGQKPPKTAAGRRVVPVPALAMEFLAGHRRRCELEAASKRRQVPRWIFAGDRGEWMQPRNFNRAFKTAVDASQLTGQLRVHDLRHTCGTAMLSLGAEIGAVARYLGHADGGRTLLRTYHHPDVDAQRAGAAALSRRFALIRGRA